MMEMRICSTTLLDGKSKPNSAAQMGEPGTFICNNDATTRYK